MATKGVAWFLAFLCCGCYLLAPSAAGWSNGGYSADYENPDYGSHDWIANHALELQTRDVTFLSGTYHSRYLLGTEAPDNPDLIGDTFQHHLYYHASGTLQEDNAADRAAALYNSALTDLKSSQYSDAAYHIGIMTHYIADAGAYGHTMGEDTDWGAEVHHSDYEDEVNSLVSSYVPAIGSPLGATDAYNCTLSLARDVTFGNGAIRPNVWMDQNYSWTDTDFVTSAKATLDACVVAVASAVNSLMVAVNADTPPDDDEPKKDPWPLVILGAVITGVAAAIAVVIRLLTRK